MKKFLAPETILQNEVDPAFKRRAGLIFSKLLRYRSTTILNVGCGRGFYEYAITQILPDARITGIDINNSYLNMAKELGKNNKITFIKASVYNLPFADSSFDTIIASEILEHLNDDELALREIKRVLKKDGKLFITVPNKDYPFFWDPLNYFLEKLFHTHVPSNIWWLAGIWADHARLYDENDLINKVKKTGFKIKGLIRSTHYCFPFAHFLLYGIGKNLVEKGFLKSFNRFEYSKKKSFLSNLSLKLFNCFDLKNENANFKKSSFVNIIVIAGK